MSVHADVITPNASRSSRPSLIEGVLVTSTLSVVAGFGFVAVYLFNRGIVPAVLVLSIAAGMGLIAGFITRFELPRRSAMVRWWVALFGLCAGMIPQGWLSQGVMGFNLTLIPIKPDLDGLLRLSVGGLSAWLAVRAWAGRSSLQTGSMSAGNGWRDRFPRLSPDRPDSPRDGESTHGVSIPSPRRRPSHPTATAGTGSRRKTFSIQLPRIRRDLSIGSRRKRARHRQIQTSIHLLDIIEHRCPFCLDLVERRDARGIVECKICHTLHHADCWAVTGTCQVPHHNV
jgi:ribosomal protein L37AE/L43A